MGAPAAFNLLWIASSTKNKATTMRSMLPLLLVVMACGLRSAPAPAQDAGRTPDAGEVQEAYWSAMRQLLEKRVNLSVSDRPLQEVVMDVSRQVGTPIWLDRPGLHDAGIDGDEPVSVVFDNLPLRFAMEVLLSPYDLTCCYDREMITVTSNYGYRKLHVRVYPIGDLLQDRCTDFDGLTDLIHSIVAAETWAENGGGDADTRPAPFADALVISQTAPVQLDIEDLLARLRWAKRVQGIPERGAGERKPCRPAWERRPGMGGGAGEQEAEE